VDKRRRTATIQAKVTPPEKNKAKELAAQEGRSLSGWLRRMVQKTIGKEK